MSGGSGDAALSLHDFCEVALEKEPAECAAKVTINVIVWKVLNLSCGILLSTKSYAVSTRKVNQRCY